MHQCTWMCFHTARISSWKTEIMLLHRKSTSSIPTHFQCSTETDSFHSKAVLPIRNVPDAAYNNTTTTTTKQNLLLGELSRGHLFQTASGQHPCCLGTIPQWQPALLFVKPTRENNYTTGSATFKLQSGHFPSCLQQIPPSGNLSPFSIIRCSMRMETSC